VSGSGRSTLMMKPNRHTPYENTFSSIRQSETEIMVLYCFKKRRLRNLVDTYSLALSVKVRRSSNSLLATLLLLLLNLLLGFLVVSDICDRCGEIAVFLS
jgi:hypothetical protein